MAPVAVTPDTVGPAESRGARYSVEGGLQAEWQCEQSPCGFPNGWSFGYEGDRSVMYRMPSWPWQ